MNLFDSHLVSWVVFSPLLGIVPLFLLNRGRDQKIAGLVASLVSFVFSLRLFLLFDGNKTGFQFPEVAPWFPPVFYRVGVDGLSLVLIMLTTFLVPIVLVSAWREITVRVRGFVALFLLLETGMLGAFAGLDLILFYVFWEAMLIPMYFLIGVWGGPRRIYAATKFILYTMAGSLLMLAAILYLYFVGGHSFNLIDLYALQIPLKAQMLLFGAFALAFAIKVPIFPFHTWLPDAHVEAPTAGSVILAGVLLKMGTYGLMRFAMPLFPEAMRVSLPILLILATIGIVYGALVAMVQPDLKKLVAYSSVSHLGFVVLGLASLTPQGVAGATLQMVNHGLSTGALFLLVGMIYERCHTREIARFGGLAFSMPLYAVFFVIVALSSLGLPGTNGFVGEFLILIGAFREQPIYAVLGGAGVILAAVYLLWMVRRVFFGARVEWKGITDLSGREVGLLLPIVLLIFWIGVAPGFLLKKVDRSVHEFVDRAVMGGRVIVEGVNR